MAHNSVLVRGQNIARTRGSLQAMFHAACRRRRLAATTERVYFQWVRRYVRFHDLTIVDWGRKAAAVAVRLSTARWFG